MMDYFMSVFFLGLLIAEINANPCGGYIQTLPGSIQTPNYPASYPPSTECTWIIEAAEDHNVHLIFITFDIVLDSSCTGDKVEFKDGLDAYSPWIASYCGNISPPNITTTGRYLYIRFISDDEIQTTGMHLVFDQVQACKINLNDNSGFISTPNYPNNYPSLTKCVWIINPPNESIVQLTIIKLEIEYEDNCLYDSLNIHDGKNDSFPLLAKYCGFLTDKVLNSTSNFLFIQFTSDTSDELSGFIASYQIFITNTSQKITTFESNKSDPTLEQWNSIEVSETIIMDFDVFTSALTIGSPDDEFLSTIIYDPSIEDLSIVVSASATSEQESEMKFSSPSLSTFSSTSSTSAIITEHVDRRAIEIMSSSSYYTFKESSVLTVVSQNGCGTLMSVLQSEYETDISVSRESLHFETKPRPISGSYDIIMNTKTEQIHQPTTILDTTHLTVSLDGMSTESVYHTAVENETSPGITIALLSTTITLTTCGIVIGVVCAIKSHVKKIANLKVAPVDDPL